MGGSECRLREKFSSPNVICWVKFTGNKMEWTRDMRREKRNVCVILVGGNLKKKSPLERSGCRGKNNIKMDLRKVW